MTVVRRVVSFSHTVNRRFKFKIVYVRRNKYQEMTPFSSGKTPQE